MSTEFRPSFGERRGWFLHERGLAAQVALRRLRTDDLASAARAVVHAQAAEAPLDRVDLYLDNRCEQHCAFCNAVREDERPLGRALQLLDDGRLRVGFDLFTTPIFSAFVDTLIESGATDLSVTGNDWSRHRSVDALLATLDRVRGLRIDLTGPSTRLSDPVFRTLNVRPVRAENLRPIDRVWPWHMREIGVQFSTTFLRARPVGRGARRGAVRPRRAVARPDPSDGRARGHRHAAPHGVGDLARRGDCYRPRCMS